MTWCQKPGEAPGYMRQTVVSINKMAAKALLQSGAGFPGQRRIPLQQTFHSLRRDGQTFVKSSTPLTSLSDNVDALHRRFDLRHRYAHHYNYHHQLHQLYPSPVALADRLDSTLQPRTETFFQRDNGEGVSKREHGRTVWSSQIVSFPNLRTGERRAGKASFQGHTGGRLLSTGKDPLFSGSRKKAVPSERIPPLNFSPHYPIRQRRQGHNVVKILDSINRNANKYNIYNYKNNNALDSHIKTQGKFENLTISLSPAVNWDRANAILPQNGPLIRPKISVNKIDCPTLSGSDSSDSGSEECLKLRKWGDDERLKSQMNRTPNAEDPYSSEEDDEDDEEKTRQERVLQWLKETERYLEDPERKETPLTLEEEATIQRDTSIHVVYARDSADCHGGHLF